VTVDEPRHRSLKFVGAGTRVVSAWLIQSETRNVIWSRVMAATLIGLSGMNVLHAQTEEEVSALVAESLLLPDWSTMFTVGAGGGYNDNVFLAHADPQSSPFVSTSAELMVLRVSPEGPQFNLFATGEAEYFPDVSHKEFTAFTQVSVDQDFHEIWTAGLGAQYFYQDQVLDVSTSETNREAVPVVGHTISLRPHLNVQLPKRNWLETEASVTRQIYNAPLDNYYGVGGRLTIGHSYGRDSQVALSYEPLWRPYDDELARTASGQVITNSHRQALRQDVRFAWRQYWDAEKRWRTVLATGWGLNQENGGGYFNYTRWFVSERVRYRARGWEISAEGRFSHYDYENQAVSATDPAKRRRDEWRAALEIERALIKHLTVNLTYENENILSNDSLETYSVNAVGVSLHWEF
jgi:hypothetical protein